MARRSYSAEQIINKLGGAEVLTLVQSSGAGQLSGWTSRRSIGIC